MLKRFTVEDLEYAFKAGFTMAKLYESYHLDGAVRNVLGYANWKEFLKVFMDEKVKESD